MARKKRRKLRPVVKIIGIVLILSIIAGIAVLVIKSKNQQEEIDQGGFNNIDNPGSSPVERELTYAILDQGQGLCVLISMGDTQIIIDGGPFEGSDVLPDKIRPYAADGVVEYVIATHCHEDHVGGLQRIYENFSVKHTIYGDLSDEGYFYYFMNAAINDGGTVEEDRDMTINLSNGAALNIYDIEDNNENPNNNSVVTYLKYKDVSFLCTGDLESDMEQKLTAYDIDPTVVVAAHHGSNTSNSLLKEFKHMEYFVISAAANNDHYHPHPTVLADAIKYTKNRNVYGTWKSGDIVFTTDGNSVTTNALKDQKLTEKDAGAKVE